MAGLGAPQGPGARALLAWTRLLRSQARHAGLVTNAHLFGLAWTGGMTEGRLLRLIPRLPAGLSEIYFHPAAARDALLDRLMPGYDHEGEMAALISPAVGAAFAEAGILRTSYAEAAAAPR
jgi:chitin disaccharide deacetylase